MPEAISLRKLLLVEGQDEVSVFDRLANQMNISNIQTFDVGGKDQFPKRFPALIVLPGFAQVEQIGLIRDADDNHADAFASLCGVLTKEGFPKPPGDHSFSPGSPAIGVFILPNNKDNGVLEDLLVESVDQTEAFNCVDSFSDCISELENRPKNLSKSRAQAYLAAMPDECRSVGVGAKKKYWDFDAPCFDPLKSFLSNFR